MKVDRVLRGGSYLDSFAWTLSLAFREQWKPGLRDRYTSFRLVIRRKP